MRADLRDQPVPQEFWFSLSARVGATGILRGEAQGSWYLVVGRMGTADAGCNYTPQELTEKRGVT